ncbi:ornithine cyclodeaminase family protein [Roseospira marina]|uniref:Ornithine cyclodeaminase family protein n=1 Tax=Roseospira marina TaxID=140057 RepID=A0A5M6IH86_9PROT|nr:ornithine cyclodeaminase family protein [Roseospira marina]KAA5607653.1 ornithine cyclodeaminase family protein [Roseospira marina]MBB4312146.1 ornithine cyclodeaminase [Roseospira marina]MBB5085838.1 ornithine cyclodeaminase [Roseospira marina]
MLHLDADAVERALSPRALVDALRTMFREGAEAPLRHHHTLPSRDDERPGTLLLMPAWQAAGQGYVGVKVATVFPDNPAQRDLSAVTGVYYLAEGGSGRPLALLDGTLLTRLRTAAASALGADLLARPDARTLLMVGTGALAPHFIRHHAAVRPYTRVLVWGRDPAKARAVATAVSPDLPDGTVVEPVADLAEGIAVADVISCATSSSAPVVPGALLRPGQHLDMAGGFTPLMRETDDEAMRRGRVFVDTDGALVECGDLVDPLKAGAITRADIQGDLFQLCRGERPGRGGPEEITVFKSVGTALEDLAAAAFAYERATGIA